MWRLVNSCGGFHNSNSSGLPLLLNHYEGSKIRMNCLMIPLLRFSLLVLLWVTHGHFVACPAKRHVSIGLSRYLRSKSSSIISLVLVHELIRGAAQTALATVSADFKNGSSTPQPPTTGFEPDNQEREFLSSNLPTIVMAWSLLFVPPHVE